MKITVKIEYDDKTTFRFQRNFGFEVTLEDVLDFFSIVMARLFGLSARVLEYLELDTVIESDEKEN